MKLLPRSLFLAAAVALPLALAGLPAAAQKSPYPPARQVDQVDDYHGTQVADPYRWLEDDNSAETAAWVKAENALTQSYLEGIPYRPSVRQRLSELLNYERATPPERRGEWLYYRVNSGLQNQDVIVRQKGLDGVPETVLDPNALSAEGTTRVSSFTIDRAGRRAAYMVSQAGSDWQEIRVIDLASKKALDDRVQWVKVSGLAWLGDGFFYSRYPAPEAGKELSSKNENHRVFFHRMGTPQDADEPVFEDPAHPQRFNFAETTEDGRFTVLSSSDRGQGKLGNSLAVRDNAGGARRFVPVVAEIGDARFDLIGNDGGRLLVRTDLDAPNMRIVAIDPKRPAPAQWKTLVAESAQPIESATVAGGRLFVQRLVDVASRVEVYRLDGRLERAMSLPGLGAVSGLGGNEHGTDVFYAYTSLNVPASVYRYEIAGGRSSVFRAPKLPGFDPAAYESRQVFYASKDGTRVPMFLVHRKGLKLDGSNPTLLYGYGGFNITEQPKFSALRIALLEQGFVYAQANIRGGGEYGEAWHRAGTKLNKQNVFDDFIAAAEWLIREKYTSSQHLAVQGGSNGGLLVGAVINQRPELFRAAVPQVGVMDMLRFQKFTIGWNWIADYGSSDDAQEFKALFAYSPLHNVRPGQRYPSVLITTADHDDRVVPAHSFKYAATMQAKVALDYPVLIRIETQSGHGASSTAKQIATTADIDAFLFNELGVRPSFPQ